MVIAKTELCCYLRWRIMKKILGLLVLPVFLFLHSVHAQTPNLSNKAQISVLTCGSGEELYTAFGHTAFRVQDPTLGIDVVYNYGTFDFNKPNFFLNFAKGKLIYSLSRRRFDAFLFEYQNEKRWVKEQLLQLTNKETNELFGFLENNYKAENRDYLYDPLFNNCSTITADILKDLFGSSLSFNDDNISKPLSFRSLVHQHINTNSWGAFGIDIAFGGITDRTATIRERMFLPYQAMQQLRNTTKNGEPIVKRERTVLNYPESTDRSAFITGPFFWFLLLFLFVAIITALDYRHQGRHQWLDFILFLVSGFAGLVILLLWIATDHIVTHQNFNFLWLLPANIVVGFYILPNKELPKWLKNYLFVALALCTIVLLLWIFKIQIQSWVALPLLLTLVIRYLFLLYRMQLFKPSSNP